ncbi:hypothetical protein CYMTET_35331 [Cymbomonas tetramitiformis]|uniref:Uncharacterized protein n=1 Tax=Cymbomonas tetramitiformis TaxID=36881 RepID=A0AAE0F9B3_9CHLO|nr:hypothetical protein CYMTET_35331 [Cymbomonas tetramitiformis]
MKGIEVYKRLSRAVTRHAPLLRLIVPLIAAGSIGCFADLQPEEPKVTRMAAVSVLMAGWWMSEAIPFSVTALLPIPLLPLLGIADKNAVASAYMNDSLFLFIGSFLMAAAIERSGLHRRVALLVLVQLGVQPRRLLLGFIAVSAFWSMWLSNTATAAMMVPMAVAVMRQVQGDDEEADIPSHELVDFTRAATDEREQEVVGKELPAAEARGPQADDTPSWAVDDPAQSCGHPATARSADEAMLLKRYSRGVVLSCAYACSIGGMSTLTGTGATPDRGPITCRNRRAPSQTPVAGAFDQRCSAAALCPIGPNIVFSALWGQLYPESDTVSFGRWLLFGFPLAFVLLLFLWVYFCTVYCPPSTTRTISQMLDVRTLSTQLSNLGHVTWAEKVLMCQLAMLTCLLMTRNIHGGLGWGSQFSVAVGDGSVIAAFAILLFVTPARSPFTTSQAGAYDALPESSREAVEGVAVSEESTMLLQADAVRKIDWDVSALDVSTTLHTGSALSGGGFQMGTTWMLGIPITQCMQM